MGTQEARIVNAKIDDKGGVQEISDPFYHHFWDPDTRLDRALEEEHYGWTLKPMLDKGIALQPVFPGIVDICTNDPDDTTHLNTIAAQRPEFVKLDVGYWGDYNRNNPFMGEPKHDPPQRNFGMIQGRDVWLCNYSGAKSASGNSPLPAEDSPAGQLLKYLSDKGLNVEFIFHAVAPSSPFTQDMDSETCFLFFSDLHLPERFPDAPDERRRAKLPDSDLRKPLRKELRDCQHEFGLLAGNSDMDDKKADFIQQYLDDITHGNKDNFTIIDKHIFSADKKYTYSYDNVLTEKAILDRTIRTRSCWFYGPTDGNKEDGDHEDKSDFAKMTAAPALDLATFLAAVLKVKNDGEKISVIQLGDLYELWMGREFLYLDFPVTDKFSNLSIPRAVLTVLQSKFLGENDEFQYRFDEEWLDSKGKEHGLKRYPFHQFPKSEMIKRHKTGWAYLDKGSVNKDLLDKEVPADKLRALRQRLSERGFNVEQFSLPMPPDGADKLNEVLANVNLDIKAYRQFDSDPLDPLNLCPVPPDDYRWHRLIFDLFQACDFRNIHGNHDGYRSDPVLAGCINIPAEEWISMPGIWIEHGHRWDEFNRDGCAIGAGMTNMVYYHNKEMLDEDRSSTVKEWFMPQDQKCFLPGAAQWYLLVNMTNNEFKSRDGSQTVLPFGIIVVGHTHHPDLCYIRYEKEGSWGAKIKDAVEKVAAVVDKAKQALSDAKDKLVAAKDKALKELEDARQKLAAAKDKAQKALQDAKDKASQAVQAAKDKAAQAVQAAKDKAAQVAQAAKEKADAAVQEAQKAFDAAKAKAKAAEQALDDADSKASGAASGAAGQAADAAGGAAGAASGAAGKAGAAAGAAGGAASGAAGQAANAAGGAAGAAAGAASGAAGKAGAAAGAAGGAASGAAGQAAGAAGGAAGAASGAASGAAGQAAGAAGSAAGAASGAAGQAAGAAGGAAGAASGAADNAKDAVAKKLKSPF